MGLPKKKEGVPATAKGSGHIRQFELTSAEIATLLSIGKIVDAEIMRQAKGQQLDKFRARIPREDATDDDKIVCKYFESERIRTETARRYNAAGWNTRFSSVDGAYHLELS